MEAINAPDLQRLVTETDDLAELFNCLLKEPLAGLDADDRESLGRRRRGYNVVHDIILSGWVRKEYRALGFGLRFADSGVIPGGEDDKRTETGPEIKHFPEQHPAQNCRKREPHEIESDYKAGIAFG